ncbi:MAG: desulfoferrodoxin [Oscillospiraceae bacterium]|jgi:superoxide reductase|nr:desulfoferrodoxin [Oscillospiraceae bacterium]
MSLKEQKFYVCKHCGNIIGMIESSGAPVSCCGDEMSELVANTTDGAVEKHLPVVEIEGNKVIVSIGSVPHPMLEEHHISWVYLQTNLGGQRKCLEVGAEPKACFKLCKDETPTAAFEYCNLHGLWKTDIK